jgi:DNA sulfur modification protein DndC
MQKPNAETKRSGSRDKLTKESLTACLDLICGQYLADGRPWVIGYSGGKDSTCVLQLAWTALTALPREKLTKPVYVITSDTLVETPAVETHLAKTINQIGDAAKAQGLPFEAHEVSPIAEESFWVNLIGRGYPAPYTKFRWCTEKLKIRPTTKFINEKVAQYGEVVLLLGSRSAESSTRAQVHQNRDKVGTCLARHKDLPNAYVFTPIEDWSTQDVWTYLTSTKSPWGSDNNELVTMYRNAQAGECPLVIDKSTPSCGGGRFGCWTCTVVDKDRSMEAMIDNGENWLQPLLDFRNWLQQTNDPAGKKDIREVRRRTGRIEFFENAEGKTALKYGPFKLQFRKAMLEKLLRTQQEVRANGPDPKVQLIRDEELHKIRQLWQHQEGDWEDSLPAIYEKVTGERLEWLEDDWSGMGGAEHRVLQEVSLECHLPPGLLTELMDVERKYHGMSRRSGVYAHLQKTLKKDWRSLEQAWADQQEPAATQQAPKEEPCAD